MASFFRRRDFKKGESTNKALEKSVNSITSQDQDVNVSLRSNSTSGIDDLTTSRRTDRNSSSTRKSKKLGKKDEEGAAKLSAHSYFKVKIPSNARPGNKFQVYAGDRIVSIRCPANAKPGQTLQITIPTSAESREDRRKRDNETKGTSSSTSTQCKGTDDCSGSSKEESRISSRSHNIRNHRKEQLFQVTVPKSVLPGQSFTVLVSGMRISIPCPKNYTGQKIRFYLPQNMIHKLKHRTDLSVASVSNDGGTQVKTLEYDRSGWARVLQLDSGLFRWTRINNSDLGSIGNECNAIRKRLNDYAFVTTFRDKSCSDGNTGSEKFTYDPSRMNKSELTLIPANEGVVHSSIYSCTDELLATCTDISFIQSSSFHDKIAFMESIYTQLHPDNATSTMLIQVRRPYLLEDSINTIMAMPLIDFHKQWRFEFLEEEGVDAGGLKREWFHLISGLLMNPDMGLWICCGSENQGSLQINPSSGVLCEDHLIIFRFIGRVMAKAFFDGELISGHLAQYIYKILLGWPITFSDLEHLDPEYFTNLVNLMEMDDVEMACLDFTTIENEMGDIKNIELIPKGETFDVTNHNLMQYLMLMLEYRLIRRNNCQLKELVAGFYEVIPEPLLTIFDYQELELLLCGLPKIDIEDWMNNTEYSGLYEVDDGNCIVCEWFWEVVNEMDTEKRARLLQFVTATSSVPSRGFSVLQGSDGEVKLFTIHGVTLEDSAFPRSHTCFNRIDLPMYKSKEELKEKLNVAITTCVTGFSIE